MKFLANENFPLASVIYLRKQGFGVSAIGEDNPSITDRQVLKIAQREERTILTFDRDYGELIFKYGIKPPAGVIYLRLGRYDPDEPGILIEFITQIKHFDPFHKLIVYDRVTLRQKNY